VPEPVELIHYVPDADAATLRQPHALVAFGGWVDAEPLGIANEDGSMQYGNHSFEKCEKCDGTGWNRAGRKHFRQVKELRDGARKE